MRRPLVRLLALAAQQLDLVGGEESLLPRLVDRSGTFSAALIASWRSATATARIRPNVKTAFRTVDAE